MLVAQVSLRLGTRAPLSMIGSIILMFVTSLLPATLVRVQQHLFQES